MVVWAVPRCPGNDSHADSDSQIQIQIQIEIHPDSDGMYTAHHSLQSTCNTCHLRTVVHYLPIVLAVYSYSTILIPNNTAPVQYNCVLPLTRPLASQCATV